MKIKDIKKYLDDDILEQIFIKRELDLYNQAETTDKNISKIKEEYPIDMERLLLAVKNLPPHFHNCRELIMERLKQYEKRQSAISAYNNEKFYKVGFCDGIRTIIESLENNN